VIILLITIVRIPIGVVVWLLAVSYHVLIFLLETGLLILYFPVSVVLSKRDNVKGDKFITNYPSSKPIKSISNSTSAVFKWVVND